MFYIQGVGIEKQNIEERMANRKAIRRELLKEHDVVLGPLEFILGGKHTVDVTFSFTVYHLHEVVKYNAFQPNLL